MSKDAASCRAFEPCMLGGWTALVRPGLAWKQNNPAGQACGISESQRLKGCTALERRMGLPMGRKVSWLESIASINSRVPSQFNACGVELGGDAGVRGAHASSQ